MKAFARSGLLCLVWITTALSPALSQEIDSAGRYYIKKIDTLPIVGYEPGDQLVGKDAIELLLTYEDSVKSMRPVLDSIRHELLDMYQQALVDQERDDSLRRANERLQDSLYLSRQLRRDLLMNDILDALSEASENESLMYQSLREVKRQRKAKSKLRSGFLRELFYHPATTPTGRLLLGGMTVTFTALTVVTILSMTR